MSDMKKHYNEVVRPELMKKLGLTNVMQIPKLQKIVISTGIGTKMDKDAFTEARTHIQALTGQYPVVCKAKKNVANFKLRVGQPCGMMVTLITTPEIDLSGKTIQTVKAQYYYS